MAGVERGSSAAELFPVRVEDNRVIAPDVYVLSYRRTHPFVPGQVVGVAPERGGEPRLYSIASGNDDDMIGLLYNVKPEGAVTPSLARLNAGDTIYVSAPFGTFHGTDGAATLIASGTGIAPFASMLRSGLEKDKILIHGGRTRASFYFEEEFGRLLPPGNYIRCCSRETGTGLYHGRLTKYLAEQPSLTPGRKYYLCGLAEMVVETRDLLIEKGIPYNNIIAEIYF
jgi:ferredoxin/flavodoxin---NADP+ reductase